MNAVGQPISRIDGRLKVTGSARYTADIPLETIVHAAIVYSTIANGRIVSIDTAAAENAPGVLAVLTHKNMPRMKALPWSHLRPQGQTYLPLQDDQIHYAGQPVALVVAATLDQATYAGTSINVMYEAHPPVVFDLRTAKEDAVEPPQRMWPLSSSVGDAAGSAWTRRSTTSAGTPSPTTGAFTTSAMPTAARCCASRGRTGSVRSGR